jgi:hypothetical protein
MDMTEGFDLPAKIVAAGQGHWVVEQFMAYGNYIDKKGWVRQLISGEISKNRR